MSVDTIGNFLTIIRNGVSASKAFVVAPYSKINFEIGSLLQQEGFVKECVEINNDNAHKAIKVVLKYVDNESAIHEITRASKPGCRFYVSAQSIRPIIGGLGVSILTTSQGILTHKKAKKLGVGGEVLCTVW